MDRNRLSYLSHIKEEADAVAALRLLFEQSPTPERRSQVRAGLSSKYDGAQSIATQVLGAWGGRESIDELRRRLVALLQRPDALSIRWMTISSLARCIERADTTWVLDLYFARPTRGLKHELLALASAVDPESARARLDLELRGPDPSNRHAAAKVICAMAYRDGRDLIQTLLDDSDEYNRDAAQLMLASLG